MALVFQHRGILHTWIEPRSLSVPGLAVASREYVCIWVCVWEWKDRLCVEL